MNRTAIKADWYNGERTVDICEKYDISENALYKLCATDNRRKRAVAIRKGSVCRHCGNVIMVSERKLYCDMECRAKSVSAQLSADYASEKSKYDQLAEWLHLTGSMKGLPGNFGYASYDSMRYCIRRFARNHDLPWPPQMEPEKEIQLESERISGEGEKSEGEKCTS